MRQRFCAALFDLDGVILDTESQYTQFYNAIGRQFKPDVPDFALRIKGQALHQIYKTWFEGNLQTQAEITKRLNLFEQQMDYRFVEGFPEYISILRESGIKTAIVTSSNDKKMTSVYRAHPELREWFDRVLTAEDYHASKPNPDCYLAGAAIFDAEPASCMVFEDSINGLRAGRAAGCFVVGLTTTNPLEIVRQYADLVIENFSKDRDLLLQQ
jgi:HAD superfamily hydrolase (TIGR01509 family)